MTQCPSVVVIVYRRVNSTTVVEIVENLKTKLNIPEWARHQLAGRVRSSHRNLACYNLATAAGVACTALGSVVTYVALVDKMEKRGPVPDDIMESITTLLQNNAEQVNIAFEACSVNLRALEAAIEDDPALMANSDMKHYLKALDVASQTWNDSQADDERRVIAAGNARDQHVLICDVIDNMSQTEATVTDELKDKKEQVEESMAFWEWFILVAIGHLAILNIAKLLQALH
ncbi:uncharacterized protein LOC118414889 isoform X2 [Branchiostoma floridae]|uniref:Uncharacterized protein LOC118414889 isoform X2 n=1 Tax=Branchiostoma floridae TaxID=7739 RepID=A0A9J7MQA7_BRAFL|nr:uncharacterized protein LOC118414889 isoform X2 [Branchiostoma floridae]